MVRGAVRGFVSWRLVAWDRLLLLANAALLFCALVLATAARQDGRRSGTLAFDEAIPTGGG